MEPSARLQTMKQYSPWGGARWDEVARRSAMEQLAKAGDEVGTIYCLYHGWGCTSNAPKAVARAIRLAKKKKCVTASVLAGQCLCLGDAVERNQQQAVRWFRMGAEQDYPPSQYWLGICFSCGYFVTKDREEAFQWFLKAAEQGHLESQFKLGIRYKEVPGITVAENLNEARKCFRKAAEQGHLPSQFYLGRCYRYGDGKDLNEARKWLKKAAAQGHFMAQHDLQDLHNDLKDL